MRYVPIVLIILGLTGLVVVNAGGGKKGLEVGQNILIVVGVLLLMAVLFAVFVTKPVL